MSAHRTRVAAVDAKVVGYVLLGLAAVALVAAVATGAGWLVLPGIGLACGAMLCGGLDERAQSRAAGAAEGRAGR